MHESYSDPCAPARSSHTDWAATLAVSLTDAVLRALNPPTALILGTALGDGCCCIHFADGESEAKRSDQSRPHSQNPVQPWTCRHV